MSDIFLKDREIQEIFKSHLTTESKVMGIETLFANKRRQGNTKYDPYYQRNYVWDTDKATYFIESILLGTEIPPLVFFNTGKHIEVIDGRQRFETIKRFIENMFHLTNNGLTVLKDFKKKSFDDLDVEIKDIFWDTKLRIIEFAVVNEPRLDGQKEDLIKKEIFHRYNSGITPLKHAEIAKAIYIRDDTTTYFKKQFKSNKNDYLQTIELFLHERDFELINKSFTLETVMEKIRLLLVLHNIPINYYSTAKGRKDIVIRLFENLSNNSDPVSLYGDFMEKIGILHKIKIKIGIPLNRLVFECLLWALIILEKEGVNYKSINEESILGDLELYLKDNIAKYKIENSHFYKEVIERYTTTADFFESKYNVKFDLYLTNKGRFKAQLDNLKPSKNHKNISEFESLRLNKPDASTTTIDDICRQMNRGRFLVRPPYQREETINKVKSSAIIESILLGVKLPPIFVFKRDDGISEVVDGQQRLLSILGFIGEGFIDENGKMVKSEKNNYSLTKLTILNDLKGKRFLDLSEEMREKIYDFNLSLVNIDERLNPNFDPIDLFIRLNNKPYPIRENTFEMWNSYIDMDIISTIKENTQKHTKWFHSRINNSRMENEELYTALTYFEYRRSISETSKIREFIDVFQRGNKLNFRIKDKTDITKLLNSASTNDQIKFNFLKSIKNVETFIKKVKMILIDQDTTDVDEFLKNELDILFNPKGNRSSKRTLQYFYALWYVLHRINSEMIRTQRVKIRLEIRWVFDYMKNIPEVSKDSNIVATFEEQLNIFYETYKIYKRSTFLTPNEKGDLVRQQNNICPICQGDLFIGDDIEIDHIKALALGGQDDFPNFQATHKECNRKKGANII